MVDLKLKVFILIAELNFSGYYHFGGQVTQCLYRLTFSITAACA